MKAADCLREPGDVARRESDGAVAVWRDIGDGRPLAVVYEDRSVGFADALPGDDWQPLHPAGELEAEVERLTAFKLQDRDGRAVTQGALNALMCQNDRLTARVAELEDVLRHCKIHSSYQECGRRQMTTEQKAVFDRVGVSPLPTAGDEGKAEEISVGNADKSMSEHRDGSCLATEEAVVAIDTAPAEPDCPAEEQPSKLRDESWLREAADAEDQHASVCAGDMTPRKPVCLDGVPAVLCEWEASPGEYIRGWAFGPIVMGYVRYLDFEEMTMLYGDVHVSALHPIHHDPTDAAAVELAGRIAEGGGE